MVALSRIFSRHFIAMCDISGIDLFRPFRAFVVGFPVPQSFALG